MRNLFAGTVSGIAMALALGAPAHAEDITACLITKTEFWPAAGFSDTELS